MGKRGIDNVEYGVKEEAVPSPATPPAYGVADVLGPDHGMEEGKDEDGSWWGDGDGWSWPASGWTKIEPKPEGDWEQPVGVDRQGVGRCKGGGPGTLARQWLSGFVA